MSINYSPDDLSICYRPLQYSTTKTISKTTPLIFAKVSVVEIATSDIISTNVYPTSISDNATNPTTESDYTFVFDVSRIVQDYFIANTNVLPTAFADYQNTGAVPAGSDTIRRFGVIVAYYYKSGGLINYWTLNNDIGNTYYHLNATAQHLEDFTLDAYIANDLKTTYVYPATKNRGTIYACKGVPIYISQITDDTIVPADLAYIAYKNGSPIGAGIIPSQTTTTTPEVYVKDVGSISLADNTYLTMSSSSIAALDPDCPNTYADIGFTADYDCIRFWWGVSSSAGEVFDFSPLGISLVPSFDPATTDIKVDYSGCCNDRSLILYWVNEFGTVDQYMFDSIKIGKLKTESNIAKSALSYSGGASTPHNVNEGGAFKYKPSGSERFELKSKLLSAEELEYIKYLTVSPYVFAHIEGSLVPVTIENGEFQISQQKGKQILEVVATLSNDLVIHRR